MRFTDDVRRDPLISTPLAKLVEDWSDEEVTDEAYDKQMADYHRTLRRRASFVLSCFVVIVVTAGFALTYGPMDISFAETYITIWNHITGNIVDSGMDYIVVGVRSPRIVGGILAGGGLAVCGVVMQSVLRNPLADPYTTGVSSGASFGATLAIFLGLSAASKAPIVVLGFIFALIPTMAIMAMSKSRMASSPTTMIMLGIGLLYIFNACTTVMMLMTNPDDLAAIYQWQVGSLGKIQWADIPYMAAVVIPGIIAIQLLAGKLNILATGDDSAKAMGVDAHRMRIILLAITGLISAGIVSFTGILGFVGLVTPHIVRIFMGADNRYLLPASVMFGAMLIILADLIGRAVITDAVIPAGVIMAFIGGPTFIILLLRKGDKAW